MKKNQMPKEPKPRANSRTRFDNVAPDDLRTNYIGFRLSDAELIELNFMREVSGLKRAEVIRSALFYSPLPERLIVPEVNLELARILGCSFGNLATIATAMRSGQYVEYDEIAPLVLSVQDQLKGFNL